MATSSIFASFNIKDSKTAEAFVEALEASTHDPKPVASPNVRLVTDKSEILKLFEKMKENVGVQQEKTEDKEDENNESAHNS